MPKSLPRAEHLGRERRLDRDCEVLLIKDVKWTYRPVDIVYHLDRETGLPLEVRCFNAGADRARDAAQWFWEAKSFDRVEGGRYWPMRSVNTVFYRDKAGVSQQLAISQIQVKSIHFNKEYAPSTFLPTEEPGTQVLDEVRDKRYIVPGVRKAVEAKANATVPASKPVLATRPADWASTASSAGLILGLALIAVSAFTWWRRR